MRTHAKLGLVALFPVLMGTSCPAPGSTDSPDAGYQPPADAVQVDGPASEKTKSLLIIAAAFLLISAAARALPKNET